MPEYQGTAYQITNDPALASYMDTACWSSPPTDEEGRGTGRELLAHRLTKAARKTMAEDWGDFLQANQGDLGLRPDWYTLEQAAMDFWLSRNGHGAGFWDRGLGQLGDRLHKAAKAYGSADLYAWRGWIYHS